MLFKYSNNAKSKIEQSISDTDTTLVVDDISTFPGEVPFRLTIWDLDSYHSPSDDADMEIVQVNEINGNELTIERGKEGTVPKNHESGTFIALLLTEGFFNDGDYGLEPHLVSHIDDSDIHYEQSGISITESQISDLKDYATINGDYIDLRARSTTKDDVGLDNVTNDTQLKIDSNLGDLSNISDARNNLGLGNAALRNVGTNENDLVEVLSNGKISDSVIPSLAITDIYPVSDDNERDNLDVEQGDIAIVEDSAEAGNEPATYIYDDGWVKLKTPTDKVTTVFGRAGDVLAETGDYTWAQIDKSVSDISDINNRSHTDLQDIGDNTHAQIDDHINDGDIHYEQLEISITESQISDFGTYATELDLNAHTGDDSIHFEKGDVDKGDVGLGNVVNEEQATKSEFDLHTGDSSIHFNKNEISYNDLQDVPDEFTPESHTHTESEITDLGDYATSSSLSLHTDDSSIHFEKGDVTKTDVGLGDVDNVQQIPLNEKGENNGVATLDETGNVPENQLGNVEGMEEHGNEWHSVDFIEQSYTVSETEPVETNILWVDESED